MYQMFRRLSPFILLVALLIGAEPLLHNHPLQSSVDGPGSTACAICATGTVRLTSVIVHVGAPQPIAYSYLSITLPSAPTVAPLPRSPRAPPAA
jgi:hypothetical protein